MIYFFNKAFIIIFDQFLIGVTSVGAYDMKYEKPKVFDFVHIKRNLVGSSTV